jgi:3-dehydroquinate dehydratase type I
MNESNPPRICVPVCEQYARNLTQAITRAAVDADVIELRLDCLLPAELDAALRDLRQLLRACTRPVILTLRPAEQGGYRELNRSERIAFWSERGGDNDVYEGFADIELDLASGYVEWKE